MQCPLQRELDGKHLTPYIHTVLASSADGKDGWKNLKVQCRLIQTTKKSKLKYFLKQIIIQ
jgi:hypothetical protein